MIIVLKVELQDTRELNILHTKWACREEKHNLNRQSKVNRSPSTGINFKTPMGLWSRKLADYSGMKIFACPAYARIKKRKLEPRALKCVFFGYLDGAKG